MKKQFSSLLLLGICLALISLPLSYAQTQVSLPYTENANITASASKYFAVDVSNVPDNVDVAISVVGKDNKSPKLYVSKSGENKNPSQAKNDIASTVTAGNTIIIPKNDLSGITTIYVGVVCGFTRCESSLSFEYIREFSIEADGERRIETVASLEGASAAVVRVNVPKNDKAERIVFHLDAIPSEEDQIPDLQVFINQGKEIPYTNKGENIPRTSWFEGRTIVIYKDTNIFCTDCQYTLSLKFKQFSSISMEAHVFETLTDLGGYSMLDGVKKDKFNSYRLKVQDERKDEDLLIEVNPQEGTPMVYINCDNQPPNVQSYYWRYRIDKTQDIVMTAREHAKCSTNTYFIAVYGESSTVYSIRAISKQASKLFIGRDDPVVGDIFPDEKISYEIFMPLFTAEKIVIKLDAKSDLNVDIINCRFPTDCPGLLPGDLDAKYKDQSSNTGSYNPGDFDYSTETTPTGRKIVIDPHSNGCYPILIEDPVYMEDAMPVCAYKITLASTQRSPVEYTLSADSEGHQWLFAGLPKSSSVVEDEDKYFLVHVPQKDATSVNFQLTEFSGDVIIYISRKEKYPNKENDVTKFAHEGMIIFNEGDDLSGTYYIGVHGVTASSFAISSTIITKGGKNENYALTLEEGIPQKGVLLPSHEHPAAFYKFKMSVTDDWKGSAKISVNTLRGNVLVAVTNGELMPLPNMHQWKSNGGVLEISSDDENFKRDATYYIGVFVDWKIIQVDDIVFTISYSVKSSAISGGDFPVDTIQHQFLSPLTPFYGSLKKGETEYFEAFILPRDNKITIYKQADVGDVDIYLTLDPEKEYPDAKAYDYTTKYSFKDYLELDSEDLAKACPPDSGICSFYFSVVPAGVQEETSYSLTMKRDYKQAADTVNLIPLEDGRQQQLEVPQGNTPVYFYLYAVPSQASVITVAAPGQAITIYASKTTQTLGTAKKSDLKPPTPATAQYNSLEDGGTVGLAYVSIPADEKADPKTTTIITVAIYFSAVETDDDTDPESTNQFYILASSQMTHIYTGKPYYGAVEEGGYMYFYLDVYKPDCTLLISMTTLNDGDPDLVVSSSIDVKPTIDVHSFASISKQRTELLEIDSLDIYPKKSMEGTWVIGVYGRAASTFTLTVNYEDQKMVSLTSGQPFEMYLRGEATMYFQFYKERAGNIEIKVDKLSGDLVGYVSTLKGENDLVSSLPNKDNAIWIIRPDYGTVLKIDAKDSKSCENCLILVALEAKSASKLSITITEGNKLVQVQNGLPYSGVLAKETGRTYMFSSSNDITLNVGMIGSRLDVYVSHNPAVSEKQYIWKIELTPSSSSQAKVLTNAEYEKAIKPATVSDGKKEYKDEKNNYYLFFHNPFYTSINYTFTVTGKDSSAVLMHGNRHPLTIPAQSSNTLLFYSSEESEDETIQIQIEFTVEQDLNRDSDTEFERNLRRGLPLTVNYWGEKVTAGIGQQAVVFKDYVMVDSFEEKGSVKRYRLREAFTLASKRGKFSFEIENPFPSLVDVIVMAYSTELLLNLDQNSQFSSTLGDGDQESFQVYLDQAGAWYLWAYSCNGAVDVSVDENPEKLATGSENTNTLQGGQDSMKSTALTAEKTLFVRVGKSAEGPKEDSQFLLSSSFFPKEKLYDYGVKSGPSRIKTKYTYNTFASQIDFTIDPISVNDAHSDDVINYHVRACPYRDSDPTAKDNICKINEDCKTFEKTFNINKQSSFDGIFGRLLPGKYFVQATADITHNGKIVKFIPFGSESVDIVESLGDKASNFIGTITLAIAVLFIAIVVCWKCYGKLKKVTEERGFELPNFTGRRKDYGFLGDDL
jgi:hypothetical protein